MKKSIAALLFLSARWSCLLLLHKRRVRKKGPIPGKPLIKKPAAVMGGPRLESIRHIPKQASIRLS